MHAIVLSLVSAACVFSGLFFGYFLNQALPKNHLSNDSKDAIKLASGMIATLAALVLGLLVASAKSSFDLINGENVTIASKIIVLDRTLAHYGPEAEPARVELKRAVAAGIEIIWGKKTEVEGLTALEAANGMELTQDKVNDLQPATDAQRALLAQARQLSNDLIQSRWLVIEQSQNSLPAMFFVVLLLWLTLLYVSIGLIAPRNATVISAMLVCALSYSAALFLIMEMSQPTSGFIRLPSAPMEKALAHLGH